MKDFDFDELDRAVNSVLAKKDEPDTTETNSTATPVTTDSNVPVSAQDNDTSRDDSVVTTADAEDTGSDIPVSVVSNSSDSSDELQSENNTDTVVDPYQTPDQSPGEGSSDYSAESTTPSEPKTLEVSTDASAEVGNDDTDEKPDDTDELAAEDSASPLLATDSATTSLASIPVKRGRFMDVMTPQNGDVKKPMASRGGVKLTPSSDFSSTMSVDAESNEQPSQPEASSNDTDDSSLEHETVSSSTELVEENTVADQTAEMQVASDDDVQSSPSSEQTDATPFIPDVPVEKRPLNSLSSDVQSTTDTPHEEKQPESTEPIVDQVSVDPTLTSNVPKEFDKDIMAVEANETVGESDETHADQTEASVADSSDHVQSSDATNSLAMAATTAEPHPMFDTSTLGHADVATHHGSKLTWTVVVASLFIVGAALGVLYFLYGQA